MKINFKIIILVLFVIGAFAFVILVKKPTPKTKISAATGNATISLQPASVTMPPEKTIYVWATVDKPVGFIDIDITFDPTKLMLTQEPNFSVPSTNVVSLTNMSTANSSGRVTFTAGLNPTQIANAPTGTFQIGSLVFINKVNSGSSTINIPNTESQFVDLEAIPFTITTVSATVALSNNTTTPTATATSTATSTPTATSTSTPTGSSSPSPTGTAGTYSAWDVNMDNIINVVDIGLVSDNYGSLNPTTSRADVNLDGTINVIDIGIVVDHYQ